MFNKLILCPKIFVMKTKSLISTFLLFLILNIEYLSGQVLMNTTASYSQNFDGLANSGTTNPWTDNSTISNWYSQRSGTGTTYAASAGTVNSGDLYSFGSTSSTERALGSIGSGTAGHFAHGVLLKNNSGNTITDIKVGYTFEQWRNANANAQSITVYYKISSTTITALNPNSNTGWTPISGLTLSSPINSATASALDGNLIANKTTVSNISIPSLSLADGEFIMIKWEDPDHSGADHGLAIDDVNISWTTSAPCTAPPTPNGNLTKTANCGSTDLKYTYGTGEPATNVTYYWQTSTTGTSTANQVVSGSNYNVSNATPTTYYVRAKDGNCWSTASTGIAVTNVYSPTVTNPANQSVNSSQTATFSVTATNQISYQWQYSANGTTWNNIDTVAEPSAATATYTTPATTLSMNGYLYRCIAVANSPCSNVISNSATLTVLQGPCIQEGFNNGITAPAGWTFTGITATYTTAGNYGQGSPSLKFDDSGDQIVTSTVSNASELSFWIKGQSISATQPSSLLVEGFNGTSWVTVDNITALPTVGTTKIYNSSSTPALPANLQRFRFTYSKNVGNVSFDDVKVLCVVNTATPSIILSNNGSQISAGNVPQGSINNILSTFKIDVSANTTNLLAADIYFDGTYTNTDISTNGLKLWSNTTNDFTTAINLGAASSTASTSGAGDAIVFNFNSAPKYINTGTTYFWVTADISSTATIGRTVQALSIANSDLHFYAGTKSGTASMGGLKTISLAPPQKPQTFTKNCTSNNSQELSWTPPASGSFDGYLLVARQGGLPQAVTNIVASSTSGNLDFSVAPLYGTVPQNSKILYVGSGTNVTVTGLTADLNYTFALYTYKNNGATTVYSEVTTRSQTITLNNVSAPNAVGGNTTAEVSWLNPASTCFDDIMVVVTPTSGLTFNPSGNTYTANSNYLGSGSQVVYKNNGNSVVITSLTNGTTYYIEIYVRKGSQWSKGIEIPVTPNANTVFKAGDLFFVGYNANYSGSSDEYLIATMVDIQPGTQFSIVNSRYEAGAAAGVRTRKWGGSSINASEFPGVIQVEYNGATIAKGSVLVVRTSNLPETPISYFGIINPSNNLSDHTTEVVASVVFPFSPPRVPNISISSPDQMFLVQGVFSFDGTNDIGEANYILNGTLLHGFTNRTSWVPLSQANSGGSNDADRRSRKPSELECFNFESPIDDIAYYKNDQLHSGSFREILQHISNSANWGGTYTLTPNNFGAAYAGRSFVINSGNPPGSWVSTSDTNWFYCANWENLRVPDEKTDVFISGATANADIKSNAAYAELYNKIAKARNVFVSDNILKVNGSVLNTLEVHGDININTGGLIDMQSGGSQDGKIYLYGNWNNNDIINGFNEGNGTVYLSGTQPQIINSNDHNSPETFNNLEINNNFNTAVSNNLITNGYLKIGSGKSVTIAPNDYFRIGGDITSDGNLTVESDANLLQVNNVSNTGAITVKRDAHGMEYLDYTYWASPVSGQTFKSFSPTTPDARFYQYNESNDLFESTVQRVE